MSGLCGYSCIAKTIGCIATLSFFVGGIASMISASAICWVVAIYMFLSSLVIGGLELPVLFQFVKFLQPLIKRVDKVKSGHRAVLYFVMAIFPFFCIGVNSFIAALLLMACAFFYGLDWLGPRGGRPQQQQPQQGGGAVAPVTTAPAPAKAEDKKSLIAANEEAEAEKEYPWDKFMNKVGEAAGKAVAAAVVNQAVSSVTGTGTQQGGKDVRIDMNKK